MRRLDIFIYGSISLFACFGLLYYVVGIGRLGLAPIALIPMIVNLVYFYNRSDTTLSLLATRKGIQTQLWLTTTGFLVLFIGVHRFLNDIVLSVLAFLVLTIHGWYTVYLIQKHTNPISD